MRFPFNNFFLVNLNKSAAKPLNNTCSGAHISNFTRYISVVRVKITVNIVGSNLH